MIQSSERGRVYARSWRYSPEDQKKATQERTIDLPLQKDKTMKRGNRRRSRASVPNKMGYFGYKERIKKNVNKQQEQAEKVSGKTWTHITLTTCRGL